MSNLTIEDVVAGSLYKLKEPNFPKIIGQGNPPAALRVEKKENVVLLPYGTVFKATETITTTANFDVAGYPLLDINFIKRNISQFESIS